MTYYCCLIDIFGCLFKNVKVLFISLQKISFSMVNLKKVSTFCWDDLLAVFSGEGCIIFWLDWLHWFIRYRSHIFLDSCWNTLPSIKRIFLGEWMKVALTDHIPSEYFQTYPSLSVGLMCIVFSWQRHIHTESKVITISEPNGSETSFWVGKWICHLYS